MSLVERGKTERTAKALEQRISEIAEREKKATKGPWKAIIEGGSAWIESEKETVLPFFPPAKGSNVSFVTHARMDIPFLLEALASERSSAMKEARLDEAEQCAQIAMGMTGPGNTPEQCQGYSDACRDIAKALRKRGKR